MTEQLDLFSTFNEVHHPQVEEVLNEKILKPNISDPIFDVTVNVNDKIRIKVSEIDSDDMLYFEYYKPKFLDEMLTVEKILANGSYLVSYKGDTVILKHNEVEIVG